MNESENHSEYDDPSSYDLKNPDFESGATFQHILTRADQLAFLARSHEPLEPDGRLVVAALTPTPDLMADEEGEYPWFTYANDDEQEVLGRANWQGSVVTG